MRRHTPAKSRHRLLGWWLAVLALCSLNVQGLQHYPSLMLLAGSICSAASDSASGSASSAPRNDLEHRSADCDLCCAQAHAPVALNSVPAATAFEPGPETRSFVVVGEAPLMRVWSASRPRGPPGSG